MFKSYLKIAVRNIIRHKGYSFINIFGLAVGMAVCMLILLWVRQELGFDRFHHNAENIYRVNKIWRKGETAPQAVTPAPLAPALKEEFPGIAEAARFYGTGKWLLRNGERAFYEQGGVFTDPSVFKMFTFPLVKGNPETALTNPYSMVLTETMAAKYFGGENPLGKTIRVDNLYDFSITGVMKDIPQDSHLQFNFLVPFAHVGRPGLQARLSQPTLADWHNNAFYSYVLLKKGVSYKEVNKKIDRYLRTPIPESTSLLYLQPLKDIHLRSTHLTGVLPGAGDITYIYLFAAMALIVLLIACINFMNLTTARSGKRAREIGLRKVVGARRSAIIKQFFGESLVLAVIALTFALLLVELLLPAFNEISGKQLSLDFTRGPLILLGLLGITLFTGLVAGSYPALFLSSFQPAKVLKGAVKPGTRGGRTRKVLVIFQFSLTVIFLVGAVVIHNQLDYLQSRKPGFDKEHLVYMEIPEAIRADYLSIKNEFRQNPFVSGVTASVSLPSFGRDINTLGVSWPGKAPGRELLMRGVGVSHDFIETFKMEMAAGRPFSVKYAGDKDNYILNETAIKAMGIEAPVGKPFTLWNKTGTIIGVVKDYHFRSLRTKIEPLLLRIYEHKWLNYLFVRVKAGDIPGTLKSLENTWNRVAPGYPFQFRFVDGLLNGMYTREQRVKTIFNYLTLLAICIAALGLFGLAAFLAEQRTREIGIRKVFGASVAEVGVLFSGEFVKWILAANVIAWPIAYLSLDNLLLRNYAYRITIGIGPFLFSGILALVIALLTVGYQTYKAASANPIEALRYE